MADPTDLADRSVWFGGFYELAIKLSGDTLDPSLKALWAAAGLGTAYQRRPARVLRDGLRDLAAALGRRETRLDLAEVPVFAASLERDQLLAEADVPGIGRTAAGVLADRDWLTLFLPLGALARHRPEAGAFPIETTGSRAWREPIEDWYGEIAARVFAAVPFVHAVTGFEVSGYEPDEVRGGRLGLFFPAGGALQHRGVEQW